MSANTATLQNVAYQATLDAQAIAADPTVSVWASANAGAGKTKVLIDRIARLLLGGAQPGRVLAVTYTKAAAAEMQTRLYGKLGDWTIASDRQLRSELLALDPALELEKPGTLARARALFAAALETPGGLKIQTIHAFCQTILQRFPLEAGVPPGFQMLDDSAAKRLTEIALEIAAKEEPDAFKTIAALTSQDGDRAIIKQAALDRAGIDNARSAQATPLERLLQVADLLPEDTPAALAQRAIARLDKPALLAAAQALGASSPKDKELGRKIELAFATTAPQTAWAIWLSLVWTTDGKKRKGQIFTKSLDKNPAVTRALGHYDEWPSPFCADIEAAENDIRACALAHNSAALTNAVLAYDKAWQQAKRNIGALDFDDLIMATSRLLASPDGGAQWVLYKLDAGIEHILIDEAQDTNPAQWDLLAPLFAVLEEEARDRPRTRFVVGDDKQSIFSFQGARPERFIHERAQFEARGQTYGDGRQTLTFDLSFRTGQTILNAVDVTWASRPTAASLTVVETSEANPPFERKYAFETRHYAFRDNQIGAVEFWPLTLRPDKPDLREAWDHSFDREREDSARNLLADRIAKELRDRLDAGFCVWGKDKSRPMVPSDVMILVKKRGAFFYQLIRRLEFYKVAVAGVDRIKLAEDVAIQDLIALGRFALLPQDDFNTACVLKGAFCGLVDDDNHLFPLAYGRGRQSVWERLRQSDDPVFAPARKLLNDALDRAGHLPPYEFFAAILERTLPETQQTGWTALLSRLGREVREPVEAFLNRALEFGNRGAPSLQAFLNEIETDPADVKREMDQDGAGVRVMTVHGAKGLEAPIVILPDTTGSTKPRDSTLQVDDQAQAFLWAPDKDKDTEAFAFAREAIVAQTQEEDSRLLYVAMTRARDLLIICGHQHGSGEDHIARACWYRTLQASLPLLGDGVEIEKNGWALQMWGHYPPRATSLDTQRATPPEALPNWVFAPPREETPRPRRVAPSALAPDGSEPPALSPLAPNAQHRFLRGRLIHELLQRLPDLPAPAWEEAATRRLEREGELDETARNAIVAETLAVLHDPAFAVIFGPGSRAEAAIVGRGKGLPDDMVVNGSVDRLVITPDEVLILDYKTNRPPPLRVEDVAQVYLNQMAAYRALLQNAWPDRPVRCALLWTDGPRLMEIPEQALDQALQEIASLTR
jgi:ATP-dependent helicase/nuclease subunit A